MKGGDRCLSSMDRISRYIEVCTSRQEYSNTFDKRTLTGETTLVYTQKAKESRSDRLQNRAITIKDQNHTVNDGDDDSEDCD